MQPLRLGSLWKMEHRGCASGELRRYLIRNSLKLLSFVSSLHPGAMPGFFIPSRLDPDTHQVGHVDP